jgi:alkylated DNA repair dioxygenase AlkB
MIVEEGEDLMNPQSLSSFPKGFSYYPDFLSLEEREQYIAHIRALPFVHDTGMYGVTLKRSYAQFGYSYVTVGRKLTEALPFPAWLQEIAAKAASHCANVVFNQSIVTHYRKTAGIGWHTDAPRFADCIAGISVEGTCVFQFRPNGTKEVSHELRVTPGSLYLMTGPSRNVFQHQVKPVKNDRYSLTLRSVASTVVTAT